MECNVSAKQVTTVPVRTTETHVRLFSCNKDGWRHELQRKQSKKKDPWMPNEKRKRICHPSYTSMPSVFQYEHNSGSSPARGNLLCAGKGSMFLTRENPNHACTHESPTLRNPCRSSVRRRSRIFMPWFWFRPMTHVSLMPTLWETREGERKPAARLEVRRRSSMEKVREVV